MNNYNEKIEKIVIIGGGTSGWISAAYLLKATNFNVDIELIEAPSIPRIGVGEATLPSIKEQLFDFIGVPEDEWMPKCKATYKMGIKFNNWKKSAQEGGDSYYHVFGELPVVDEIPLSQLWYEMRKKDLDKPLDYSCFHHPYLCDQFKSPRFADGTNAVHAAYHFDAYLVTKFLKEWSTKRGVKHTQDELKYATQHDSGDIKAVVGEEGKTYEADLFLDCSGFRGFLIDSVYKEPKVSYNDCLINDSAIAINLVDKELKTDIRPYTSASAMSSGWTWETPLLGRSGNGYVYSSAFQTPDDAERELREFLGPKTDGIDVRHIKFESMRREKSWVKNCVSIGLSSSFLEPLESTGIYFVYASLYQLKESFPGKQVDPILRKKYNDKISFMVDDVKDFIVMHFCTSPREDTPYWKASKYDLNIPESLQDILDLHKSGAAIKKTYHGNASLYANFEAAFDRFWTNTNYQSILGGVHYFPNRPMPLIQHRSADIFEKALKVIEEVEIESMAMNQELPSHYEYLKNQGKEKEVKVPELAMNI